MGELKPAQQMTSSMGGAAGWKCLHVGSENGKVRKVVKRGLVALSAVGTSLDMPVRPGN